MASLAGLNPLAATPPTDSGGGTAVTPVSHASAVLGVLVAGIVLVVLADYFPHLVNGFLLLILAGVVLKSEAVWTPWVAGAAQAFGSKG
jgi:hypothetical protein